ncbi:MAG: hypothetical protein M3N19_01920, partial [Candidatus Eremiobacteraeota bacterium]|nr:hypothetical protein [Candidatus Eremiobacteraeota bacterium]
ATTCKGKAAHLYPFSSGYDGLVATGAAASRSDGYLADVITLQGVRSYDPNAGQWTTPDAYVGDVHDPMTQRPFMWNKNNPFRYADASGYDTGCHTLMCSADGTALAMGADDGFGVPGEPPDERADAHGGNMQSDIESALTLTYAKSRNVVKDGIWPTQQMAYDLSGFLEGAGYRTSTFSVKDGAGVKVNNFEFQQTAFVTFGKRGTAEQQMHGANGLLPNRARAYYWNGSRDGSGQLFWRQYGWPRDHWLPVDFANPYLKG